MAQGNKEHNFLPIPKVVTNCITTVTLSLGGFYPDVVPGSDHVCTPTPVRRAGTTLPSPSIESLKVLFLPALTLPRLLTRSKDFNSFIVLTPDSMMEMPDHMTDRYLQRQKIPGD
jgi:hypothetical protein